MRYIKTYENTKKRPKLGDYVICGEESSNLLKYMKPSYIEFKNFLSDNIGRVVLIRGVALLILKRRSKWKWIIQIM